MCKGQRDTGWLRAVVEEVYMQVSDAVIRENWITVTLGSAKHCTNIVRR